MHKMIINNLGPIFHAELAYDQFMVLTGFQASGKSTIAKTFFYFKTVKDDVLSLIIKRASGFNKANQNPLKRHFQAMLREKFLNVFGSSMGMDKNMSIEYYYREDVFIKVRLENNPDSDLHPNYVWTDLSPGIEKWLGSYDSTLRQTSNAISDEEKQMIRLELSDIFCDEYETVFIPAGRSMITLLADQLNYLYSIMDDAQKRGIDFCTRSYLEYILKLKPEFEDGLEGLENNYPVKARKIKDRLKTAKALIQRILKGAYRYNQGNERLEINKKHYVKINFTSSGQQESLWILNLLFYYTLQNNPTFFIIEEPESHLFPEAQKSMIELIALVYNCGHNVLVTTHSPYILGSCNNLIYASQIAPDKQALAEKIINRLLWIKKEHINAWFVRDGNIQNCIDPDTGMVKNELIDEISNDINQEFDELLNIQTACGKAGE
jgi:energy-coupling factor transporter ATP-binding protein EcfA2